MGHAVKKIRRSIKGIDDPTPGWILTFNLAVFLSQEPVVRPRFQKLFPQDRLGGLVRAGDEVAGPLSGDLQVLDLTEVFDQAAGRLAGGFDHDVEVRGALHGRVSLAGWAGPYSQSGPSCQGVAGQDRRCSLGGSVRESFKTWAMKGLAVSSLRVAP